MSEKVCIKKTIYHSFFEDVTDNVVFWLSKSQSEALWDQMIYPHKHSYFDLPADCWIVQGDKTTLGFWMDSYHHNDGNMFETIRAMVDWSDMEKMIFFVNRKVAFAATWQDFMQHWTSFIAVEDDCPIVMPESGGDLRGCIIFEPLGKVAKIVEILK